MKIEKDVPLPRFNASSSLVNAIAKEMEVGDSVFFSVKEHGEDCKKKATNLYNCLNNITTGSAARRTIKQLCSKKTSLVVAGQRVWKIK